MNKRLKVICPGRQAGGANLLLSRCAIRLYQRHGFSLALVDLDDGATAKAWKAEGIPFDFSPYEPGSQIVVGPREVVLISLLGAKLFPSNLKGNLDARLVAWCTAPQDPFKFLPPSYFLNNSSWSIKRSFARSFFPAHRARIANFLSEGSRRGGVIFMDEHCHEVNQGLFDEGIPAAIVPICTAVPAYAPRLRQAGTGKAYWVGRITDFKTEPFVAMTRARLFPGSPIKEVVVIGDGADLLSTQARLAGLPVNWLGYIEPERLDAELHAQADLVFGHGTALLEAAKLGIPALLVDGTYESITPEALRADWLHRCPLGYVGRITAAAKLLGRPIEQCLSEFSEQAERVAIDDYQRWKDIHNPDVVADLLADVIERGDYTVRSFLTSGAAHPGWFGSAMEWTKRNIFRRRY